MSNHCGCHHMGVASQSLEEMEFERGLWQAAIDNDLKKAENMISRDTDCVNSKDKSGYTALHYAARAGHMDMCRLLLDNNSDVNSALNSGDTPLHRASYMGHSDVVSLLLKNGAVITQNDDGQTSLHKAAEKGFLEIARLLVLSDENIINIKDSRGRVAADVLKVNKNDELWEGFASLLQNKT